MIPSTLDRMQLLLIRGHLPLKHIRLCEARAQFEYQLDPDVEVCRLQRLMSFQQPITELTLDTRELGKRDAATEIAGQRRDECDEPRDRASIAWRLRCDALCVIVT